MVKEKITLSIERNILKQFKEKAKKECWSISQKVEKFFNEELKKQRK